MMFFQKGLINMVNFHIMTLDSCLVIDMFYSDKVWNKIYPELYTKTPFPMNF